MKPLLKIIICTAAVVLSQFSLGQTTCSISANIYYINGLNNPNEGKVQDDSNMLGSTIAKFSTKTTGIKKVYLLYNNTDNLLLDTLYIYAAQKAAERNSAVADVFVSVGLAAFGLVSPLTDAEQLSVRQSVNKLIVSTLPSKTQEQVTEFSRRISVESLNVGTQVVLVPHSQGNMYADAVIDNINLSLPRNRARGLEFVSVASPGIKAFNSLWLTANQDLVINSLASSQALLGWTLPPMRPNIDASSAALMRTFGHSFTGVYLAQDLPTGTTPANSIAAALVKYIDIALTNSSTFHDAPNYILVNGVKKPRPPTLPYDSTVVQVCFPDVVGGF